MRLFLWFWLLDLLIHCSRRLQESASTISIVIKRSKLKVVICLEGEINKPLNQIKIIVPYLCPQQTKWRCAITLMIIVAYFCPQQTIRDWSLWHYWAIIASSFIEVIQQQQSPSLQCHNQSLRLSELWIFQGSLQIVELGLSDWILDTTRNKGVKEG